MERRRRPSGSRGPPPCGHPPEWTRRGFAPHALLRVVGERQIVLPAFGKFTGGSLVTPCDGERLMIVTARGLFDVTPGRGERGAFQRERTS